MLDSIKSLARSYWHQLTILDIAVGFALGHFLGQPILNIIASLTV